MLGTRTGTSCITTGCLGGRIEVDGFAVMTTGMLAPADSPAPSVAPPPGTTCIIITVCPGGGFEMLPGDSPAPSLASTAGTPCIMKTVCPGGRFEMDGGQKWRPSTPKIRCPSPLQCLMSAGIVCIL